MINSYHVAGQSFYKNDYFGILMTATNTESAFCTFTDPKNDSFYINILEWDSKIWDLNELITDKLPKLNCIS